MAIARTEIVGLSRPQKVGQQRRLLTDITITNYSAGGGETLSPADLGMSKIHAMFSTRNLDGTHAAYDIANNKFKSLTAAGAESAGASSNTFRVEFVGF